MRTVFRRERGKDMSDAQLERLITGLEASFDASIARQEEEAADDLAFGLLQDRSLVQALSGARSLDAWLPGGSAAPVVCLGADHVVAGERADVVIPLASLVVTSSDAAGTPEVRADETLLEVLRGWARLRAVVEVVTRVGAVRGRLIRATTDHLELQRRAQRFFVGHEVVEHVRLLSRGRVDAR
jgi:hypothetical protein